MLLLALDSGKSAILILLNVSAAFDTVENTILPNHLQHLVGIRTHCIFRKVSFHCYVNQDNDDSLKSIITCLHYK